MHVAAIKREGEGAPPEGWSAELIVGTARRESRPPRFREPSRGAGVSAAIPGCGMVPMWPSRVRECSLAATLPGELSGRVF